MATDHATIDVLIEHARLGERLSYRRMFGEYALYVDGKVVGFACDDRLFVKLLEDTQALTSPLPRGQPYPGAKPYAIADELLDDPARLSALLLATAQALPAPRTKLPKPRSRKKAGGPTAKAANAAKTGPGCGHPS